MAYKYQVGVLIPLRMLVFQQGNIRKDVRELITINEKIQSALLTRDVFTDDEVTLIRQCATELLKNVPSGKTDSRALTGTKNPRPFQFRAHLRAVDG